MWSPFFLSLSWQSLLWPNRLRHISMATEHYRTRVMGGMKRAPGCSVHSLETRDTKPTGASEYRLHRDLRERTTGEKESPTATGGGGDREVVNSVRCSRSCTLIFFIWRSNSVGTSPTISRCFFAILFIYLSVNPSANNSEGTEESR